MSPGRSRVPPHPAGGVDRQEIVGPGGRLRGFPGDRAQRVQGSPRKTRRQVDEKGEVPEFLPDRLHQPNHVLRPAHVSLDQTGSGQRLQLRLKRLGGPLGTPVAERQPNALLSQTPRHHAAHPLRPHHQGGPAFQVQHAFALQGRAMFPDRSASIASPQRPERRHGAATSGVFHAPTGTGVL